MATKTAIARKRKGRPTQEEAAQLEERLRHAAVDVFIENGYEATSMEAVARAASITKRTLYARYADKNALFADAVVWALTLYHARDLPPAMAGWSLPEGLREVANSILTRARDPDVMRLNRLAVMEAARIPGFSTKAYSTMWSPRVRALAQLLESHKKAGNVVVDDVEMAAEQFLAMVGQSAMWLAVLGQSRPPRMAERYLRHAIDLFLRAIQPPQQRAARASAAGRRSRQAR
jgi:AcrR family transcriptional regulator